MPVWERIEESLSRGSNIEEGHFMERSWGVLMSTPPPSDQIRAIRDSSEFVDFRQDRPTNIITNKAWYGCYWGALLRKK